MRFSFYVQGVSESTAILPDGWRERLVRYETPATKGVAAWCLDLHDLWVSKALAGRPKDLEFCRALLSRELVERDILRDRLSNATGVPEPVLSKAMKLTDRVKDD